MKKDQEEKKPLLIKENSDPSHSQSSLYTFGAPSSNRKNHANEDSLDWEDQILLEQLIKESEKKIKEKQERKKLQERQRRVNDEINLNRISSSDQLIQSTETRKPVEIEPVKNNQYEFMKKNVSFHQYQIVEQNSDQMMPKVSYSEKVKKINYEEYKCKSQNKNSSSKFPLQFILNSSLASSQKEILIDDTQIYFPYEPYPSQLNYMQSLIRCLNEKTNALLQSPTGTGKTLCLLCGTMSWVQSFYQKTKTKKKIIYLSRTHAQLQQVSKQLQKTSFRPTMSLFGSRDHFCVKDEFQEMRGRELIEVCSKAVKMKLAHKRKMKNFENQQEIDPQKKKLMCDFYKDQTQNIQIMKLNYANQIINAQTIKRAGKQHEFCPYYYSLHIKQEADILLMPYNYILDSDLISKFKEDIEGSILIFDEAHNVPEAACQGYSFSLKSEIFQNLYTQVKKLQFNDKMTSELKSVSYEYEYIRQLIDEEVRKIYTRLNKVLDHEFQKIKSTNRQQYSGEFQKILKPEEIRKFIIGLLGQNSIPLSQLKYEATLDEAIIQTVHLQKKFITEGWVLVEALKQTFDGVSSNIQRLLTFLGMTVNLLENSMGSLKEEWWEKQINHYRIHIKYMKAEQKKHFQVKIVCLSPALAFKKLYQLNPRNIILTSGTLNPLSSWTKELGIHFEEQLTNGHVISPEQMHLAIVRRGIRETTEFNFSYKSISQKSVKIYEELTDSLIQLISFIPNGVLVIFPSYRIMEDFKSHKEKLYHLRRKKQLLFQKKLTDDMIIKQFKKKSVQKTGSVLFCVCRGKVCQGIDFSDEYCRSVIFVGVPFPNIKDLILQQKKQYYSALSREKRIGYRSLSGDQWYCLNTMRAVNQAIGRVIRHIHDYGMIYLFDCRYQSDSRIGSLFPQWSKVSRECYDDFRLVLDKTRKFFGKMEEKFEEINLRRAKKRMEEEKQLHMENRYLNKFSKPRISGKMKRKPDEDSEDDQNKFDLYLQKKKETKDGIQMLLKNFKTQIQEKKAKKAKKSEIDFL